MNENRAELIALLRALARMREKCVLTLYTESEYLYQGLKDDGHVEKWIKSGWKTVKGTEVKNRDLWQKLMAALQGIYTHWRSDAVTRTLQGYMQRWRERSEKYEFIRKVWRI
ncbi:MAG: RNase H family protein [Roseburia sp.]